MVVFLFSFILFAIKIQDGRIINFFQDFSECKASMFELENSLRCANEKAKEGHNIREDMARLQHRLTASSENEIKLRSVIDKLLLNSKKAEESILATQTYNHHTQSKHF